MQEGKLQGPVPPLTWPATRPPHSDFYVILCDIRTTLLNCSKAGDWNYLPARNILVMELEAGKAKIFLASVSSPCPCLPSLPKRGVQLALTVWGGKEPDPVAAVAPELLPFCSANGKMRVWLFPISLQGHAAACFAYQSNKVWAGKKGKQTCLSWRGGAGRDPDRV